MSERAAGPGGLFKASRPVNPGRDARNAARLKLHRARVVVQQWRHPSPTGPQESDEEARFEEVSDITNFVEQRIEESMRQGKFRNLKNAGKPLSRGATTTADVAMRIMRDNGLKPHWIQLLADIDEDTRQLRQSLVDAKLKGSVRDWNVMKEVARRERIKNLNAMIDSFNLHKPECVPHLFRLRLKVGDEIRRAVRQAQRIQRERMLQEEQEKERVEEGRRREEEDAALRAGGQYEHMTWRKLVSTFFNGFPLVK